MNAIFTPFLKAQSFVVLDGALSTSLEALGCQLNDTLWSARILVEAPEKIEQVHFASLMAGANVIITSSYQATLPGLAAKGFSSDEALEIIKRSVTLARQARQRCLAQQPDRIPPLIAGSVGPYGAYLADGSEYRGDYHLSDEAFAAFHTPRIEALLDAGADLLAIETLPSLAELKALLKVLASFPAAQAWVTFSAPDEAHISDGTPIETCIAALDGHPQICAVGINCTAPRHIDGLLDRIRHCTSLPIVVYPNGGEQYDPDTKRWCACETRQAAQELEALANHWHSRGAQLIGGCCGIDLAGVEAIARAGKSLRT